MIKRELCTTTSDEFECPWCSEPIEVGNTFYYDINARIIGCSERCVKKISKQERGGEYAKLRKQ